MYNKVSENKTTGLVDWGNVPGYASGIVDWPVRYEYDRTTTQRTVLSTNAFLNYHCIEQLAAALSGAWIQQRADRQPTVRFGASCGLNIGVPE